MTGKTANIAIFVPHMGCPHRCSFCDQQTISGETCPVTPEAVTETLTRAVAGLAAGTRAEIAFFGGSFTAIPTGQMEALLQAAYPFLGGSVTGIRCSTRPDAIDEQRLTLLKRYGVTTVELGAQSMEDSVLAANLRGHTARQVRQAAGAIKQAGLRLGLQMMTGLYTATPESDRQTARALAELEPQEVRIYPTAVLPGTALARWYRQGLYTPPSLEETVALCADLLDFFEARGIRVIKLGLHAGMEPAPLAGPFHPAFRELCESHRYYIKFLPLFGHKSRATVAVHPTCLSRAVGHKKENLARLQRLGFTLQVTADDAVPPGQIVEKETPSCS